MMNRRVTWQPLPVAYDGDGPTRAVSLCLGDVAVELLALSEQAMASSNCLLASVTPPRQLSAAVFSAFTSSCSYPWQDDAENGGETERCLPIYTARSMKDDVPKQSHDGGDSQGYSKRGYKTNE
jgi:hypothetical protein